MWQWQVFGNIVCQRWRIGWDRGKPDVARPDKTFGFREGLRILVFQKCHTSSATQVYLNKASILLETECKKTESPQHNVNIVYSLPRGSPHCRSAGSHSAAFLSTVIPDNLIQVQRGSNFPLAMGCSITGRVSPVNLPGQISKSPPRQFWQP